MLLCALQRPACSSGSVVRVSQGVSACVSTQLQLLALLAALQECLLVCSVHKTAQISAR
jgi:hypothetical protein